jgi:predicted dehydrogenase
MSSRPLRVGVVGAGGVAQMMHLPTLAERPDLFEIVALADIDRATLDAVGRRYGVRSLHTDQRAVVEHAGVEAVVLAASGSHRECALAALAAGKHLFVEKPLGFGRAETEELAAAARTAPGVCLVAYHKRYDPAVLRAVEAVRAMRGLRWVEVTVLHPDDGDYRTHHAILPPRGPRRPVPEAEADRACAAEVTSGPLVALVDDMVGGERAAPVERRLAAFLCYQSLIHDLDLVRGVVGAEPEEVVAAHVWRGGLAQTSVTRFAGELRASLSWVSLPGLKHYEESVRFVSPEARVTLVFPSPYLRHAPTPLTIERMEGGALVVEEHTVSYEEAFRAELHHFRDCVLEGRRPRTGVDDALADMRWIQAIVRAYAGAPARVE